jgi:methoxymalonate biosynthesis acyl carrier protein
MMNVEDRLRQYIAEQLRWEGEDVSPDTLTNDAELIVGGLLDSLRLLELSGFIQQEYGFDVDDLDLVMENFATISRIAAYVRRKTNATELGTGS